MNEKHYLVTVELSVYADSGEEAENYVNFLLGDEGGVLTTTVEPWEDDIDG